MLAAVCIAAGTAAALSALLIVLLKPALARYALAHPNARSSHKTPTPQGAGIGVIAATLLTIYAASAFAAHDLPNPALLTPALGAVAFIAVIGAIDDLRTIAPSFRLVLQGIAVAIVIGTLPGRLPVLNGTPEWLERTILVLGLLWFVNLVNFMDGMDWMTVVEILPIAVAVVAFALAGLMPADAALPSAALAGAVIGFAPFNRPRAAIFLGDVGSLPIGLLSGWLLLRLAADHPVAALLLPMYYLADTTVTLARRLYSGEAITKAHRSHFYQRAVDDRLGVNGVLIRVFAVNIALIVLATISVLVPIVELEMAMLAAGAALVAALLGYFSQSRS
jgi:UDP-N-acetylmuramyl pentapeptide phosphotransferase/UDP-N-acetylglucosamine-1-phosphate transferase